MMPDVAALAEHTSSILEVFGIALIYGGVAYATILAGVHAIGRERGIYTSYRRQLPRAILRGLEVLVAADIIATVAISPTLTSVGVSRASCWCARS